MRRFEYINSKGKAVQLDGPLVFSGIAEEPRSRVWAYSLGMRDVRNIARPARTATMSITAPFEQADELRKAFDSDVYAGTPGTFVIDGEWKQRGFCLEQKVTSLLGERVQADLTVALLDGAWWRIAHVPFVPESGSDPETYPWLDYNFDFIYDFKRPPIAHVIDTDASAPSPVRIVIYGPATNPYIIAGENRYAVLASVSAGAYMVIDGKEKTITIVGADGSITDAFSAGVRGSGEGGGEYVFEPIPTGAVPVSWDNSFGFDFGWYQEEGEPPWSRS